MAKYLDNSGLNYLWSKIKSLFVPQTRTINGKSLNNDISLNADDIGVETAVIKLENTDSSNKIPLRTLDSGTYVLNGYFTSYTGGSHSYTFSTGMLVSVLKQSSVSYVQIFYPKSNTIQYIEISDDAVVRNDAKLSNMETVTRMVSAIDSYSDDSHYPSAKAVYDAIPKSTSELTNNSGFLTTETDPTVPAWAKSSNKPTYTASEVGALPDSTVVPTKTSQLTNDSGYKTTDNNTTYSLSKSGSTITLTGSDGTTTSVTDSDSNTTYGVATTSANGLMSATDKSKLDGIESGANLYTHPTTTSVSAAFVKVGKDSSGHTVIGDAVTKSDITALGIPSTNTTYSQATSSTLGLVKIGYSESGKNYPVELNSSGQMYVNVPWTDTNTDTNTTYTLAKSGSTIQLKDNSGTVVSSVTDSDSNTTYSNATTSSAGLMSASDKSKLDGIDSGANAYSLPTATASVLGGVKTGSNITNSSGTISITKSNVTSALGYTPPTTNTTYSNATDSTAGLVKVSSVNSSAVTVNSESTTSGRYYPVELNSDGKAIVNVPWTDNNTVYTHPSYTARTGKPTANATPSFGGTFTVSQITSDSTGHVTGATDRTVTIPSATATSSANGLMSNSDKAKLDGYSSETWTFTLEDGSTVTKTVVIG